MNTRLQSCFIVIAFNFKKTVDFGLSWSLLADRTQQVCHHRQLYAIHRFAFGIPQNLFSDCWSSCCIQQLCLTKLLPVDYKDPATLTTSALHLYSAFSSMLRTSMDHKESSEVQSKKKHLTWIFSAT